MQNKRLGNKLVLLLGTCFSCMPLTSCDGANTLLLLNWGEYINEDLVKAFEEEYHCTVKESIADSNELFYSKLKSGTTVYDLVVPSDYMVKKMKENDLIQELDLSKLKNYNRSRFLPGVIGIEDYFINEGGFPEFEKYQIPYFWGTFGLMYNKRVAGLEEALYKDGWDAYFNKDKMPKGTRSGMYNVPRDSYAATMFHHHLSPNVQGKEYLDIMRDDLTKGDFEQWGTDDLKKQIQKGDLDVAYMYTGDFLDMFYTDINDETEPKKIEDVQYDIYIPDETIAFLDSLVLTKKAIHIDLAYKFMDFFLRSEVAMSNASVVGYCTPLQESYDSIVALKDSKDLSERNWSYAMTTYYPIIEGPKPYIGTPLTNFDKNYLTEVNNVVNDVKTH